MKKNMNYSQFIRGVEKAWFSDTKRAGFADAHTALTSHKTILNCFARQSRKIGFTLAEVLITLGIIGVVAAMTLPVLIQKNNNRVVETRLKKFYSSINQAILMAEADYGDKNVWFNSFTTTGGDEPDVVADSTEQWFNKYFKPYMNVIKTKKTSDAYMVYFADGSALRISTYASSDWSFYPGKPEKCIEKYGNVNMGAGSGVCFFLFHYGPNNTNASAKYHYNKGVEPYKFGWDGDINTLKRGSNYSCYANHRAYCTALIQMNGWKIPDDYPWKVSY